MKSSPTTSIDGDRLLLGLPGVGPKTAERLAAVGLVRVEDLLRLAPRRYDDAKTVRPFAELVVGEHAFVVGVVKKAVLKRFFSRATLEVTIADETTSIVLRWFRFRGAVPERFAVGAEVSVFGQVRQGKRGLEMAQPIAEDRARVLQPRYTRYSGVSAALIESLCALAVEATVREPLGVPDGLPSLTETARVIHALPPLPEGDDRTALIEGRSSAHRRLAFEELLLLRLRASRPTRARAPKLRERGAFHPHVSPTAAQARAIEDVARDLARDVPMRRLLTGDVGSGKTLVAAAAIEQCIASGHRAAFLAPTTILAEQQAATLRTLLARRVALVHAGVRRRTDDFDVVVGTHALESLAIDKLALVVIDEQQRFGVASRSALVDRASIPHLLSLSATPIPRTLARALRGELAVSHLDELPPGRAPVETAIVATREEALRDVRKAIARGEQAFWICPQIDDEDVGVLATAEWLGRHLPVHVCHGRQRVRDRTAALDDFREQGGLLVATTVVEVGVDVPNATRIVIESPARLGLSQLHQLRGRVGRGSIASRCLLVTDDRARMQLLVDSRDGLAIAEADLRRRGMGDLGGVEQSGMPSLPPLAADELEPLVEAAERAAAMILDEDPTLSSPRHQRLARALARADRRIAD